MLVFLRCMPRDGFSGGSMRQNTLVMCADVSVAVTSTHTELHPLIGTCGRLSYISREQLMLLI